jgi:hypothetical protein
MLPAPLVALQPVDGLLEDRGSEGGLVFAGHEMCLDVPMALPCHTLSLGSQDVLDGHRVTSDFGVVPVGWQTLRTRVRVIVWRGQNDVSDDFVGEPIVKSGPAALWARRPSQAMPYGTFVQPPEANEPRVVEDLAMGIRLRPRHRATPTFIDPDTVAEQAVLESAPFVAELPRTTSDPGAAATEPLSPDERRALLVALGFDGTLAVAVSSESPREVRRSRRRKSPMRKRIVRISLRAPTRSRCAT